MVLGTTCETVNKPSPVIGDGKLGITRLEYSGEDIIIYNNKISLTKKKIYKL